MLTWNAEIPTLSSVMPVPAMMLEAIRLVGPVTWNVVVSATTPRLAANPGRIIPGVPIDEIRNFEGEKIGCV